MARNLAGRGARAVVVADIHPDQAERLATEVGGAAFALDVR